MIKFTKKELEFLIYVVHTYEINDYAPESEQKADLKLQASISKKLKSLVDNLSN